MPPRPDTEMSNAGLPPYFVRSTLEDVERLPAIHPSIWVGNIAIGEGLNSIGSNCFC